MKRHSGFRRKLLAGAISSTLCLPLATMAQEATTQGNEGENSTVELDKVVVTGSLIPRAQLETASPTISITAEDLRREGFKNAYDALRSASMATGSVQDSQETNSFTPGANTVSLLGLDPSFTLVLLNGRPLADYPLLYNGSSNFVDLAAIPTFLIERIDILPGNQSAVYGSAAIAGVVNILLKKDLNGHAFSLRLGDYTDGGGASQKFTAAGGSSGENWNLMYGFEYNNQEPIYGHQRDFTDSTLDSPSAAARIPRRDRMARNAFTGKYVDPGKATCDAMAGDFNGGLAYVNRPGFGYYCGAYTGDGNATFMNARQDTTGYLSGSYHFGNNSELYADALYNSSKVWYRNDTTSFWQNGVSGGSLYFYDLDTNTLMDALQHFFAPEETQGVFDRHVSQQAYIANVGVRGGIGDSSWDYDVYFHRSAYQSQVTRLRQLSDAANAFFYGPQDGEDPLGYGFPAYHIFTQGRAFTHVTPEDFRGISDTTVKTSETYAQNFGATVVNASLFDLPAGSVGFAGILEVGNQFWSDPFDPRISAGQFWGAGGTSGEGKRDRQAIGAEFTVPLLSSLTLDASVRYDRYSVPGSSQGKPTYKVGLEFRPTDTLLIRGNYATAFRAPDMGYVFSGGSTYFSENEDYYNCRVAQGDAYVDCDTPYDSVQYTGKSMANKELEYITSKSWGLGAVWSPTPGFSLRADYYDITIDNQVSDYSEDTILEKEADCRLGHKRDGSPVDSSSAECVQILSQVTRSPSTDPTPNQLLGISTSPINIANERVSGVTANVSYRFDIGRFGSLSLVGDYNRTLKHEFQQFPEDPVKDYLSYAESYEFRNIGSVTVGWDKGPWAATLRGTRYGPSGQRGVTDVDNNPATPGVYLGTDPWITYNASVQYQHHDNLTLSLVVNNLTNERPPTDPTWTPYPYFNLYNYNAFGRLVMLEMTVRFGGAD
ncbi:MAG: TonB-dependent receptor [Pseudoxanthomonas sp.]